MKEHSNKEGTQKQLKTTKPSFHSNPLLSFTTPWRCLLEEVFTGHQ